MDHLTQVEAATSEAAAGHHYYKLVNDMSNVTELREQLNEAHRKVEQMTAACNQLEDDELAARRKIDDLITSDDSVKYRMAEEDMRNIKSQRLHLIQSTGIARGSVGKLQKEYDDALDHRTLHRRKELIAQLKESAPGELQDLFDAARIVLIHTSMVGGNDISVLSLDRLLSVAYGRYADDFTDEKRKLLASLKED